ncbi:CDP-6-deoxy-delta-3,4-glucoseen reductase [Nitrosomonas sp. Nm166]|uniref:CDP-6-deoxy-delta-3,4-glucoseen reductase n=1 Tax=Nitrosomonas sp. Nm166 TaxID=1881054 RepID=UPI0008F0A965|nr:CDP-6-deoxy-delta-3,4-glucoseen reductase [Nitrosomonas sp. Nm166]SFE43451.1 CDP-4-dehydro-6-deoxyglucose reductase [Nitrosomonas sp. Nm166]
MSHQVIIQPSGHVLKVESGETILEAALREGFSLPYGCRNGSCGICKGKILEGTVDYGHHNEETLTEEEKQAGKVLFCCASPLSDLVIECHEISATKDIEIKTLPCRVHKLELVAPNVMIISLKLPTNQRLQFLAGQYIDILLKDGKRRSFSLANAPHDDEFLQLHARNYPGGTFAEYVFMHMKVKDMLRFTGPLGSFFLRDAPEDVPIIFLASGTGFAPIKSILEHVFFQESSRSSKRKMILYWGARTRADLYLPDLPAKWQQEHENFTFVPVLSEPLLTDNWEGRTGLVHQAVLQDYPSLETHQVYACGSPGMVKAAYYDFTNQCNLPRDAFFSDVFTPSTSNP